MTSLSSRTRGVGKGGWLWLLDLTEAGAVPVPLYSQGQSACELGRWTEGVKGRSAGTSVPCGGFGGSVPGCVLPGAIWILHVMLSRIHPPCSGDARLPGGIRLPTGPVTGPIFHLRVQRCSNICQHLLQTVQPLSFSTGSGHS